MNYRFKYLNLAFCPSEINATKTTKVQSTDELHLKDKNQFTVFECLEFQRLVN